jgi:hypothetical protein
MRSCQTCYKSPGDFSGRGLVKRPGFDTTSLFPYQDYQGVKLLSIRWREYTMAGKSRGCAQAKVAIAPAKTASEKMDSGNW